MPDRQARTVANGELRRVGHACCKGFLSGSQAAEQRISWQLKKSFQCYTSRLQRGYGIGTRISAYRE